MYRVSEIPRGSDPDSYFSSIYKPATGTSRTTAGPSSGAKRSSRVNYNFQSLEAQAHGNTVPTTQAEEKASNKRFEELNRENYNDQAKIEIPKSGLEAFTKHRRLKPGETASTKRILASRKTLVNYVEEVDPQLMKIFKATTVPSNRRHLKKLCSICGNNAPATCVKCGARFCSVSCGRTHEETRCTW
ncbi:BA75_00047T0 [Komagataella pastoris]|uniref:BA75_00047T0 n=1 Tax=Komagataella pastoris TaxID=4922 RepID=A0A1B2J7V8_PICPA|nr:BA75_00047T0 [Komagataella pastoris]